MLWELAEGDTYELETCPFGRTQVAEYLLQNSITLAGIYVLEWSSGWIKIGQSGNLVQRIKQHLRYWRARETYCRRGWIKITSNHVLVEKDILNQIERCGYIPVLGNEIFSAPYAQVKELID